MKKVFFPLVLCIFLTSTLCQADMPAINETPGLRMPVLNPDFVEPTEDFTNLSFNPIPAPQVKRSSPSSTESSDRPSKSKYVGFLSQVSPDYAIKRNPLSLTRISTTRRKRSIMFVFVMNKDKISSTRVTPHNRMHIMMSKKLVPEQKVIDNEYPIDVSMAKYDDGYASREWNLVLPNKKPREVGVSLLWSF